MSEIKNGGLDQYGAEPLEQRQLGTAGVEGVNTSRRTGSAGGELCLTRRRRSARAALLSCCRGSEYALLRYSSRNSEGPMGVASRTLQLRCHFTFDEDADDEPGVATDALLLEPCTGVR